MLVRHFFSTLTDVLFLIDIIDLTLHSRISASLTKFSRVYTSLLRYGLKSYLTRLCYIHSYTLIQVYLHVNESLTLMAFYYNFYFYFNLDVGYIREY